ILTSSSAWCPGLPGTRSSRSFRLGGLGAYVLEICSRLRAGMGTQKKLGLDAGQALHYRRCEPGASPAAAPRLGVAVAACHSRRGRQTQAAAYAGSYDGCLTWFLLSASIRPSMPFWEICWANWLR